MDLPGMDAYTRQACFYPGALITLPITVFAVVVFTTAPAWWSALSSVLVASGVTALGTHLVRDQGKKLEPGLWTSWGGAPSTQALRFANATNKEQVKRRHDLLERMDSTLHLTSEAEEQVDPKAADDLYGVAVEALISKTTNRMRFWHLAEENRGYGFRRNLLACKSLGRVLSILSLVAVVVLAVLRLTDQSSVSWLGLAVAAVTDAVLLLVLIVFVTPDWLRRQAESYCRELFKALAELVETTATTE
jgi:hypothetical protein